MTKRIFILVFAIAFSFQVFSQSPIQINQIGYEVDGPKTAVYHSTDQSLTISSFKVLNASNNQEVYSGDVVKADSVVTWRRKYFWFMDFTELKEEGEFKIECNGETSYKFKIGKNIYFTKCLSAQLDCYTKMRNTDSGDRNLRLWGSQDYVDLYGGYNEASGDASKHITHLQYSNYLCSNETPMLPWVLLRSYELNSELIDSLNLKNKLFEEVAWGADYLMRCLSDEGYFYTTIFNQWNDTAERVVCAYEVIDLETDELELTDEYESAFREGGGTCIAALAKASHMNVTESDDYTPEDYLNGAKKAYDHIKANNLSYCNDGKEHINDDYGALMAAIELYRATDDNKYKNDAGTRVDNIIGRLHNDGWFACDDAKNRPYYQAAEEGMPILSLLYYMEIDNSKDAEILETVQKNIDWYFKITDDTNNPFNYVRLYAKPYNYKTGQYKPNARTMFFMPKDSNETGYWFQGENARLGSMTTAFLIAATKLDENYKFGPDSLTELAMDQLNWILGKNPYEICMFYGQGIGIGTNFNPPYCEGQNFVGGICNGITAAPGYMYGDGIEWAPNDGNIWTDWRWLEQWLPHEFWYTLATATLCNIIRGGQTDIKEQNQVTESETISLNVKPNLLQGNIQITIQGNLRGNSKLSVYDLRGRILQSVKVKPRTKQVTIDSKNFSAGLHLIELQTGKKQLLRKKVYSLK